MTPRTVRWSVRPRRRDEEFARLVEGSRAGSSHASRSAEAGGNLSTPVASADPELVALARLARALRPALKPPTDDFRLALRNRLLTAPAAAPLPATPAARAAAPARPAATPLVGIRRWTTVTAGAAGLALAATGTAAASTSALPGEILYPVKRGIESVQLGLNRDDLREGELHLDAAQTRLLEVASLLEMGGAEASEQVPPTLHAMEESAKEGSRLLLQVASSGQPRAALTALSAFVAGQEDALEALGPILPPALAPEVGSALTVLEGIELAVDDRYNQCPPGVCQGPLAPPPAPLPGAPSTSQPSSGSASSAPASPGPSQSAPGQPRPEGPAASTAAPGSPPPPAATSTGDPPPPPGTIAPTRSNEPQPSPSSSPPPEPSPPPAPTSSAATPEPSATPSTPSPPPPTAPSASPSDSARATTNTSGPPAASPSSSPEQTSEASTTAATTAAGTPTGSVAAGTASTTESAPNTPSGSASLPAASG